MIFSFGGRVGGRRVEITGISFDTETYEQKWPDSDNWASTWGSDGHLYTTWGDGDGTDGVTDRGLGVARVEGSSPDSVTATDLWGVARGYSGGKALGIISINGNLYMLAGPDSGVSAFEETWLQVSTDDGVNWTYYPGALSAPSEVNHYFVKEDGFSKPTFLNFGQDYAGARDTYVYIYGIDYSSGVKPITELNLARIPVAGILDASNLEFFSGTAQDPTWSSDSADRQPILTDAAGGMADSPSVIYNAPLGRYILAKTFNESDNTTPHGGLALYWAREPWGPWTSFYRQANWQSSNNMYFAEFPTKWISADGLTMWMVFAGYGTDAVAEDAYQHIQATLTVT